MDTKRNSAAVTVRVANIPTSRFIRAAKELSRFAEKNDFERNERGEISTPDVFVKLTADDFANGALTAEFRKEVKSLGRALTAEGFKHGHELRGKDWNYTITRAGLVPDKKNVFACYLVITEGNKAIREAAEQKKAERAKKRGKKNVRSKANAGTPDGNAGTSESGNAGTESGNAS